METNRERQTTRHTEFQKASGTERIREKNQVGRKRI